MNTANITSYTETRRNARAAGLHGIADELDSIRAHVAILALRLWRAEGGNR